MSDYPQELGGPVLIPDGLEQLSNLQKLTLSITGVTEIPASLFELRSLRYLLLEAYDYDIVGNNFGNLAELEELVISEQRGHMELPPSLFDLPKLKKLGLGGDVEYQQISHLLPRLADTLEEFDVSRCFRLAPSESNPDFEEVGAIQRLLPNTRIIWE